MSLPATCNADDKPSQEEIEFMIKYKNDIKNFRASSHPWCLACDMYYHKMCLILSAYPDIDPTDKTIIDEPKYTDLKELFIFFEKMRVVFTFMLFHNPLSPDISPTDFIKFNITICLMIERILLQLFHCINARIYHHENCVIPPENSVLKYGNHGDRKHSHVLAVYAIECLIFYEIYEIWIMRLNFQIRILNTQKKIKQEYFVNIFTTDKYKDDLIVIYLTVCHDFPTQVEFYKYYNTKVEILKLRYTVIDHNDLLNHLKSIFYTDECETYDEPFFHHSHASYKKCSAIVYDRLKHIKSYISDITLNELNNFIDVIAKNVYTQCTLFLKSQPQKLLEIKARRKKHQKSAETNFHSRTILKQINKAKQKYASK
jgi:hypothetical protein